MRRRVLLGALGAAALGAGGCAAPQSEALRRAGPATSPRRSARVGRVPFYAQREYECGPAALASAMNHAGVAVSPPALVPEVWIPARRGALQAEMLAAPRRRGLLAVRLDTQLESVLRAVDGGLPVVVFQNLGIWLSPVWHYAVLLGYDLDAERVSLHSGVDAFMEESIHVFERTWVRAGSWAMTASQPRQLPQGASESSIVRAAAALERVEPAAALRAWDAVLERWPRNRTAALGRGNAAWAGGDRRMALRAWRHAVERHPDFADAWNNLAHALEAQGEHAAAREAAQRAIALGGPRVPAYHETLQRVSR